MHILIKRDLHQWFEIVALFRLVILSRSDDRVGFVGHAEVQPRLTNVALGEEQLADLPAGSADGVLEWFMGRRRQLRSRSRWNRRNAQLMAFLHQQGVKKTGVIFVLAEPITKSVD